MQSPWRVADGRASGGAAETQAFRMHEGTDD